MTTRNLRRYYALPDLPARGAVNHAVWVVIPLARTNLITNGSFETNTTSWTGSGASIARSTTEQYHGTYSLAVTPTAGVNTDGAFYGTVATSSGTPYVASLKVKIPGAGIGKQYQISIADTSGNNLATRVFLGTGRWQWVWTPVYNETSSTNRRVYIRKLSHAAASVFYVDGAQMESCSDGVLAPTTYIDGDQLGLLVGQQPPPYGWNGTPHASTSFRTALTRAGGYLVNLSAYNFLVSGLFGLGMAVPNNVAIPYTVNDGARYQRTTKPPRTFTLTGRFQAATLAELLRKQSEMRSVLDRDLVPVQQPLSLVVEPRDDCDNPIGDFAQIPCLYAGGLEGDDGNLPLAEAAPAFTAYLPYLSGGDAGASLTVQTSVSDANYIVQRSVAGVWSALSTGLNGAVWAILPMPDGTFIIGGNFTNAGGVAAADYIAKYDPTTNAFTALGTGGDDQVYALALAPNGTDVYATGAFTVMGGVANTSRIAKWSGSAWSALSTGLAGGVAASGRALAFNNLGILYVGGDFTAAGASGADYIASWNGTAFSNVGGDTALNAAVFSLLADPAGNIYAGGSFTNAGGVAAADRIARWSGSAWSALSTGADNTVFALARAPNGILYAGGSFTTMGGLSISYVAQWNGTGWSALGTLDNTVTRLFIGRGGSLLYASGDFTTTNGVTLPDQAAQWNGSTWLPLDIDLPSAAGIATLVTTSDGRLFLGFKASGTATAAAITSITNSQPGYVYPRLVIKGPSSGTSRIYQILNYSTGYGVWMNYTIQAGETAIFEFDPQHQRFYTTAPGYDDNGDLDHTILPGSMPNLFYLAPGTNSVSFFAASSTVTATLSWQKRYNGVADLVN